MARRRRGKKRYKLIECGNVDMGSAGDQVKIAKFDKVDAQGITAYIHNIRLHYLANDTDLGDLGTENVGCMFYLTTDDAWSDGYVFAAAAGGGNGTNLNLSAKRFVRTDADDILGNLGPVYLWGEVTDATDTADIDVRLVIEAWGYFHQITSYMS